MTTWSPVLQLPAIPTWPQSRLCRPIWLLWPIMTRLSIFVPSPIRVASNVARSIVQLAPISTSSPTSTRPVWGTLTCLPSTNR